MLNAAVAVSVYTKVKMVNRDWTEEQIQEEVNRILEESKIVGLKPPAPNNGQIPPKG